MKRLSTTSASLLLGLYMGVAQPALSSTVDDLQATYRALGATTFDATRGELHWLKRGEIVNVHSVMSKRLINLVSI